MNEHSIFYYPYASFTYNQSPLMKVATIYSAKLTILDPVAASCEAIGADHPFDNQQGLSSIYEKWKFNL